MHSLLIAFILISNVVLCEKEEVVKKCVGYFSASPSVTYPCVFPFKMPNGITYNECIRYHSQLMCPVMASDILVNAICKCENVTVVESCPKLVSRKSGERSITFGPFKTELQCDWQTKLTDLHTDNISERAATVLIFNRLHVDGDLVIYEGENQRKLLRATDKKIVSWTNEENMWVSLRTGPFAPSKRISFEANIYTGFCSHFNAVMNFTTPIQFEPYAPSISSNYNYPIKMNYRPSSYCTWLIRLEKDSNFSMNSIYFSLFDLGTGDTVLIEEEFVSENKITIFDINNPPQPIYTKSYSLRVVFQSDGVDERLGFSADIFHKTCSKTPVELKSMSGTITDGSHASESYAPNLDCSWLITQDDPKSNIAITFNYYFLLNKFDVLSIHDGENSNARKIPIPSASNRNSSEIPMIWSTTNKLFITFKTNPNSTQYPPSPCGFSFNWKVCSQECHSCPAGTYYNFDKKACRECPPLKYSTGGRLSCDYCPPGTQWESSKTCTDCHIGSYGFQSECLTCPEGKIAPYTGMTECESCSNTSFAVNNTCQECKEGERSNNIGNGCEPIPVPPVPLDKGTIILYACLTFTMLIIVVGVLAFLQWKKSRSNNDIEYSAVPMFE